MRATLMMVYDAGMGESIVGGVEMILAGVATQNVCGNSIAWLCDQGPDRGAGWIGYEGQHGIHDGSGYPLDKKLGDGCSRSENKPAFSPVLILVES